MAPKKFWRWILTRKTKDNNRIALHDWNSYIKKLYESPNAIHKFETLLTMKEVFTLEDINFRVKHLENGKAKDIEGYQVEILKIGGPHIHKPFNQVSSKGSLNLGLKASLSLFLNVGKQINPLIIGHL